MEERKNYQAYSYRDCLKPGEEIVIDHTIRVDEGGIEALCALDEETLLSLRQTCLEEETEIYEALVAKAGEWEEKAVQTKIYDRALSYLRTPEVEHTSNKWRENEYHTGEEISNKVYRMNIYIREETRYNRDTKKQDPIAWYVSWHVSLNLPGGACREPIAGQSQKRYADKDAAMKYVEGRKKAYGDLFTEISPPIPKEYGAYFKVNGMLLPGYTIEGDEKDRSVQAAAEKSDGGFSVSQKTSVLGKLDAAKGKTSQPRMARATEKKKVEMR